MSQEVETYCGFHIACCFLCHFGGLPSGFWSHLRSLEEPLSSKQPQANLSPGHPQGSTTAVVGNLAGWGGLPQSRNADAAQGGRGLHHWMVNVFTKLPSWELTDSTRTQLCWQPSQMNMLSMALLHPLGRLKYISGYDHKGNNALFGVVQMC